MRQSERGHSRRICIFTSVETPRDIVTEMARARKVERLVARVTGRNPAEPVMKDLAQTIYLYMLTFPEDKLLDLYQCGQLDYFLVRVIVNQWYGSRSSFRVAFRKFSALTEDINDVIRREEVEP